MVQCATCWQFGTHVAIPAVAITQQPVLDLSMKEKEDIAWKKFRFAGAEQQQATDICIVCVHLPAQWIKTGEWHSPEGQQQHLPKFCWQCSSSKCTPWESKQPVLLHLPGGKPVVLCACSKRQTGSHFACKMMGFASSQAWSPLHTSLHLGPQTLILPTFAASFLRLGLPIFSHCGTWKLWRAQAGDLAHKCCSGGCHFAWLVSPQETLSELWQVVMRNSCAR